MGPFPRFIGILVSVGHRLDNDPDAGGVAPRVADTQCRGDWQVKQSVPCAGASAQEVATGLSAWYRTPAGRAVGGQLQGVLDPLLEDVFGYYGVVVTVGAASRKLLRASPIKRRFILGGIRGDCDALARADTLPVQTDSVDLVVLHHALEYSRDPHAVLREVDRILIPEGHLVIIGFNPWSRFGLWGLLQRRRPPWCGSFYSGSRVRDWIALLGFELKAVHVVAARGHGVRHPERPFTRLGGGPIHVHHAIKRVATLTPLRPAWRARAALLPGKAAEPTLSEPKAARVAPAPGAAGRSVPRPR